MHVPGFGLCPVWLPGPGCPDDRRSGRQSDSLMMCLLYYYVNTLLVLGRSAFACRFALRGCLLPLPYSTHSVVGAVAEFDCACAIALCSV